MQGSTGGKDREGEGVDCESAVGVGVSTKAEDMMPNMRRWKSFKLEVEVDIPAASKEFKLGVKRILR